MSKTEMSAIVADEKSIGPQDTDAKLSGTEHLQELEDIDHVVENVRARVSTPLVRIDSSTSWNELLSTHTLNL